VGTFNFNIYSTYIEVIKTWFWHSMLYSLPTYTPHRAIISHAKFLYLPWFPTNHPLRWIPKFGRYPAPQQGCIRVCICRVTTSSYFHLVCKEILYLLYSKTGSYLLTAWDAPVLNTATTARGFEYRVHPYLYDAYSEWGLVGCNREMEIGWRAVSIYIYS